MTARPLCRSFDLRGGAVCTLFYRTVSREAYGLRCGIQIGHCGNMTHLTSAGQIPIGASSGFNLYAYTPVRGMRRSEITQVAKDFGRAVTTAHDAGFDSVEVHVGHGYLISKFLSPSQGAGNRVRLEWLSRNCCDT